MKRRGRRRWKRNMVVLLDTNVVINYMTNRDDRFQAESIKIMDLCGNKVLQGYLAFHSLSTIWYSLRKYYPDNKRREMLKDICNVLTVVGAEQSAILDAIDRDSFKDFEDCLQDKCAAGVHADYLITCNIKDYTESETKAVTPAEFLRLI